MGNRERSLTGRVDPINRQTNQLRKRSRHGSTREVYKRSDGKWAFRVTSGSDIVATDGDQGYDNKADAKDILKKLVGGTYDGEITELD